MAIAGADFTLVYRHLCDAAAGPKADAAVANLFKDNATAYHEWATQWRARLAEDGGSLEARQALMRAANPAFIPRNHRVEQVIVAAVHREDFGPFETLIKVLAKPYQDQPGFEPYADPPTPEQVVHQTFCGT